MGDEGVKEELDVVIATIGLMVVATAAAVAAASAAITACVTL